ncbi:MAG: RraA family protein [Acidobacteria bacterium]|nr:RraA family protein [Acidobacteriota bacterium]MBI3472725.1 RraA family protein [Candidatus Solibacter usitatus]
MPFPNDAELFDAVRRHLYTAVVGDVLDVMGHRLHFLPPRIRPLRSDMIVIGRAAPAVVRDEAGNTGDRFGKLLEALDALRERQVYITNGGQTPYSLWGELMSTRATHLNAAGAVLNGYCRDEAGILALGFPTFCWGAYALDISFRGKVVDYGVPVQVGDVPVAPGDVIFGDRDGVLVVPQAVAEEAFEAAFEKVRSENKVRDAFRQGMSAAEAFGKFGVM